MKIRRLGWQGLVAELAIAGAGAAWKHYQTRGHAKALARAADAMPPSRPGPALVSIDPMALVAALQAQGMAHPAIGQVLAAVGVPAPGPAQRRIGMSGTRGARTIGG